MELHCETKPHRHGKDRQGFQRWKCPVCGHTWSDSPAPGKSGRKLLGDKPMTGTERKRRSRERKKKQSEDQN